jgi:hypothetical protein
MSKQEKRDMIKRALIAATSGVSAEDLAKGGSLSIRSGIRAGDGSSDPFVKTAPQGPFIKYTKG